MKKHILKHPRARRMLDLITPGSVYNAEKHSSYKNILVQEVERNESVTISGNQKDKELENKTSYDLRDVPNKIYDERDKDNEDFSPEASEYIPSSNQQTVSRPLSTTSSFGGDFICIDGLLDSKIRTPSTISNLSTFLDSASSPTAVYSASTPKQALEHHNNDHADVLNIKVSTLDHQEIQPFESCLFSNIAGNSTGNQTGNNLEDETLISAKGEEILRLAKEDETLKQNQVLKEFFVNGNTAETSKIDAEPHEIECVVNNNNKITTCKRDKNEQYNDDIQATKGLEIFHELSLSVVDQIEQSLAIQSTSNKEIEIIQETERRNCTGIIQYRELSSTLDDDLSTGNKPHVMEQSQSSTSENQRKLTRKRSCNKNERKDNKNKKLKNSGKRYEGCRSKKAYPAKEIGPPCSCNKKCGEKFALEQRQSIFKTFYQLGDHELQWQYICRHIDAKPVKRVTLERKNNRTQTLKYYFKLEGLRMQVCKVFFLNTLKISEQTVYTALEKIKRDESFKDLRGTHLNRPHRVREPTKISIIEHIKQFPSVESHYVRKDSKRLFLSQHLNISKMFRLYQDWFSKQDYLPEQIASKRQYESIFNTEFNYSFFKPKKDLCGTCSLYEQADATKKISLEQKYREHLRRKDRVREIKNEEKATVDKHNTTIAIFDLEKVLCIPQSEIGIFYYKRKYAVYNFTVFDALRKLGHCYVWHQSIAKRGSIEIGSCLLKFIQQEKQKGTKRLSFYSDGCTGQNKNRFIFALYLHAIKVQGLETITHRFFETGHSQNEGDSMHSCVERAIKNKVLFTPDQVYSVIMNAKVTGEKYQVKEMEQNDFYDIKDLISGKNWLTDTQGRKVVWTKVMEVKVSHLNPQVLQFKYDFDENYLELNTETQINSTRRGRKLTSNEGVDLTELKHAYFQPIPISKALQADLLSLCNCEAISQHYHAFYKSLTSCEDEGQSDTEEQDNDDNIDGEK